MTGEKDPRDVMQAEHDARLSEHSAFQAPAEMPGEEDVARELARIAWNRGFSRDPAMFLQYYPDGVSAYVEEKASLYLDTARAVLDLFAPILAEKERDNRQLRLEVAEERETSRISIYGWRDKANEMEARALAAEAALAETQRALHWATKWMAPSAVSRDPEYKTHADAIAAAIRAQE